MGLSTKGGANDASDVPTQSERTPVLRLRKGNPGVKRPLAVKFCPSTGLWRAGYVQMGLIRAVAFGRTRAEALATATAIAERQHNKGSEK